MLTCKKWGKKEKSKINGIVNTEDQNRATKLNGGVMTLRFFGFKVTE